MPDSSSITIRPYRFGDERALVGLFQKAFGHPTTEEHWRWKLKAQPSAVENVWLAMFDDQPVFQYAGIPTRFWLSQTPASTMVSVDTMTAPEFRRRGLLTRVAGRVYAEWRDRGIAFVIGLPNEQWGSRAAALGWQALFPLQWLVRPLRPEAILARRLNVSLLREATFLSAVWNRFLQGRVRRDPRITTEPIQHADDAFDEFWERSKAEWMFSTVRDRAWVSWRFLSSPTRAYRLTLARRDGMPSGYCVHSVTRTQGRTSANLVELFVPRADYATRDTLLCELIENLLAAKAEVLFTLAVPGTPLFSWLRRAGFLPYHAFSVQLVPLSAALPMAAMHDPNHWNLTGADFDVV